MSTATVRREALACPPEGPDDELLELLGAEHGREYVRLFLERAGSDLDAIGEGLAETVERATGPEAGFDVLWDLAVSEVARPALPKDRAERGRRGIALGLRLAECGLSGSWVARPDPSHRFRLGRWVLPPSDRIEVAGGCPNLDGAHELPAVPMDRHHVKILTAAGLATTESAGREPGLANGDASAIAGELAAAVELLREHAPEHLAWVDRVVRHVVPLSSMPGRMLSSSSATQAGVIRMSVGGSVAATAEMLVHEASHQYFHLGVRLDDVDDGSDSTLYYSPVKDTGRPIAAILLAYHAFANVFLLYRRCLDAGVDPDGFFERNFAQVEPQLRQLDEALSATTALTDLGRSLWEPLRQRLSL